MPFPKIAILFWNTQQKNITQSVVRLVQHYRVNIVFLAESNPQQDVVGLLRSLNAAPRLPEEGAFRAIDWVNRPTPNSAMANFCVFTNLQDSIWEQCTITNRYAIWRVVLPHQRILHLAAVHFPAIQQDQGDQQRESAIALRQDLEFHEEQIVKANEPRFSIIMGDMNANPFDAGIAGVYGLNATHIREVAQRQFRYTNGQRHLYLFNPMWRFLGMKPWGTYYNDKLSKPIRYDWSILDQVLVRPDLISCFDRSDATDLWIPITDGVMDFDLSRRTDRPEIPDHRPVVFQFELPAAISETAIT